MSEFKDYAHDRTVIMMLQRTILDGYLKSDTPPKHALYSDDVARMESEVPQEAFLRILNDLQLWENQKRQAMNEFRMVRVTVPPFMTQPAQGEAKPNEVPQAPAPAPAKHRRGRKPSR